MGKRRILFYSHDTFGLGHLRRTLKLAGALAEDPDTTCLVVTGSGCPQALRARPRLDFVKLPSVIKTGPESYPARSLSITSEEIVALRSGIISAGVCPPPRPGRADRSANDPVSPGTSDPTELPSQG